MVQKKSPFIINNQLFRLIRTNLDALKTLPVFDSNSNTIIGPKKNSTINITSVENLTIVRKRNSWNPATSGFTHSVGSDKTLIEANSFQSGLSNALGFIQSTQWEERSILFLGTGPLLTNLPSSCSSKTCQAYVERKWLHGLFSNWSTAEECITRFNTVNSLFLITYIMSSKDKDYKELVQTPKFKDMHEEYIDCYLNKLHPWSGFTDVTSRPVLLVVLNVDSNLAAVSEAQRCGIPVIGLVHTHMSNPFGVTYPIPCNTDSFAAVSDVMDLITEAIRNNIKKKEVSQ